MNEPNKVGSVSFARRMILAIIGLGVPLGCLRIPGNGIPPSKPLSNPPASEGGSIKIEAEKYEIEVYELGGAWKGHARTRDWNLNHFFARGPTRESVIGELIQHIERDETVLSELKVRLSDLVTVKEDESRK